MSISVSPVGALVVERRPVTVVRITVVSKPPTHPFTGFGTTNCYAVDGDDSGRPRFLDADRVYDFVLDTTSEHPFYLGKTKRGHDSGRASVTGTPAYATTLRVDPARLAALHVPLYAACSRHEYMGFPVIVVVAGGSDGRDGANNESAANVSTYKPFLQQRRVVVYPYNPLVPVFTPLAVPLALSLGSASSPTTMPTVLASGKHDHTPQQPKRIITVEGEAERELTPDIVYITLRIVSEQKGNAAAQSATEAKTNAVLAAIRALPTHSADAIQVMHQTPQLAPFYSYPEHVAPVLQGYRATTELQLRTRQLDLVGNLLDAAVRNGATDKYEVTFSLADKSLTEASLLAEASANAFRRANAMAHAVGATIVDVVELREQFVSNEGQRPRAAAMAMLGESSSASQSPAIAAGVLLVKARVYLQLLLGPLKEHESPSSSSSSSPEPKEQAVVLPRGKPVAEALQMTARAVDRDLLVAGAGAGAAALDGRIATPERAYLEGYLPYHDLVTGGLVDVNDYIVAHGRVWTASALKSWVRHVATVLGIVPFWPNDLQPIDEKDLSALGVQLAGRGTADLKPLGEQAETLTIDAVLPVARFAMEAVGVTHESSTLRVLAATLVAQMLPGVTQLTLRDRLALLAASIATNQKEEEESDEEESDSDNDGRRLRRRALLVASQSGSESDDNADNAGAASVIASRGKSKSQQRQEIRQRRAEAAASATAADDVSDHSEEIEGDQRPSITAEALARYLAELWEQRKIPTKTPTATLPVQIQFDIGLEELAARGLRAAIGVALFFLQKNIAGARIGESAILTNRLFWLAAIERYFGMTGSKKLSSDSQAVLRRMRQVFDRVKSGHLMRKIFHRLTTSRKRPIRLFNFDGGDRNPRTRVWRLWASSDIYTDAIVGRHIVLVCHANHAGRILAWTARLYLEFVIADVLETEIAQINDEGDTILLEAPMFHLTNVFEAPMLSQSSDRLLKLVIYSDTGNSRLSLALDIDVLPQDALQVVGDNWQTPALYRFATTNYVDAFPLFEKAGVTNGPCQTFYTEEFVFWMTRLDQQSGPLQQFGALLDERAGIVDRQWQLVTPTYDAEELSWVILATPLGQPHVKVANRRSDSGYTLAEYTKFINSNRKENASKDVYLVAEYKNGLFGYTGAMAEAPKRLQPRPNNDRQWKNEANLAAIVGVTLSETPPGKNVENNESIPGKWSLDCLFSAMTDTDGFVQYVFRLKYNSETLSETLIRDGLAALDTRLFVNLQDVHRVYHRRTAGFNREGLWHCYFFPIAGSELPQCFRGDLTTFIRRPKPGLEPDWNMIIGASRFNNIIRLMAPTGVLDEDAGGDVVLSEIGLYAELVVENIVLGNDSNDKNSIYGNPHTVHYFSDLELFHGSTGNIMFSVIPLRLDQLTTRYYSFKRERGNVFNGVSPLLLVD